MALKFTTHALKVRMPRRGITPRDVELALQRPIGVPLPGQPGTIWIQGYAQDGRILKVCVSMADKEHVITAAWP